MVGRGCATSDWHCVGASREPGRWKGEGKGCWEGAPPPIRTSRAQVPEATLREILPKVLRADLNSVLGSPEHLELFLLARQKVPRKLEELVGPVSLFSDENVPRYGGGGAGRAGGCPWPRPGWWCGWGAPAV